MSIDDLIAEGERARQSCFKNTSSGGYLAGVDYEKWISKSLLQMQKNYSATPLYNRFLNASEKAAGNGPEYYDTMMGILKAIKEFDN